MNNRQVLIVDDSPFFTELVRSLVSGCEGFEVCAESEDPYAAVTAIRRLKPDMIVLSADLPSPGSAKFLRRLIPQYTVPVIACTSQNNMTATMLSAGAADCLRKPENGDLEGFRQSLHAAMNNAVNLREVSCEGTVYKLRRCSDPIKTDDRLILIGGSAGSTEALPVVLKGFDKSVPPIVVSLHMPAGYTSMYAERLSKELDIEVREARDGMPLTNGCAVIAEGSKHLRVAKSTTGYIVRSAAGDKISGHCPSVDALFLSGAKLKAKKMIAVLLTGMGHDGAEGMLQLKKAGAYTIGQDEKTSVVYGMPRAAYELGAVTKQCSLYNISAAVKLRLKELDG